MKKTLKIFSVMLAIIFSLSTAVTAFAAESNDIEVGEAYTDGYYSYTLLDDSTVKITDYTGDAVAISIPSEINGYAVTSIGSLAFYNCTSLTEIVIPDSVKSIGYYAFNSCTSLESITIPESVESIGYDAFDDTIWYSNQPDGMLYIGKIAYEYKGEMPENTSIVLENGTTSIAEYAFLGCENLINLEMPNSVTSIGEGAFLNCTNLMSITVPESVTNIGSGALGYYADEFLIDKIGYIIEDFTIYGYTSTAAEEYASENEIEFVALDAVKTLIMGDANCDGVVTVADVTVIQKASVKLTTLTDEQSELADVNGDGRVSVLDATCIQKYVVGGYSDTGSTGQTVSK